MAIFGNDRSKRYALVVENGKVKEAFVEPDNTGISGKMDISPGHTRSKWCLVSAAEKVLG